MSAVRAAMIRADDARNALAKTIDRAAAELNKQAGLIRRGMPYEGRKVAHRMAAVDEARLILEALDENLDRLLKAGAA